MGVKGLWRLLLPIGRRISIETLEGKVLAIDASIWLTQFIKAMRDPDTGSIKPAAHLIGFFRRICKLRYHGIRPIFVFDGLPPEIKLRELQRRRKRRDQLSLIDVSGDNGNNPNATDALQRMAKRILVDQLKKHGGKMIGVKMQSPNNNNNIIKGISSSSSTTTTTTTNTILKKEIDSTTTTTTATTTTNTSSSVAPGFYDPEATNTISPKANEEVEKQQTKSTINNNNDNHNNNTNKNDDQDVINLLNDTENYLQKATENANIQKHETSDWDTADVAQVVDRQKEEEEEEGNNDNNRKRKEPPEQKDDDDGSETTPVTNNRQQRKRNIKKKRPHFMSTIQSDDDDDDDDDNMNDDEHDEDYQEEDDDDNDDDNYFNDFDNNNNTKRQNTGNNIFDVDYVATLSSIQRKDIIEDARRRQRMTSRNEFMKVAANPEGLSQCQLRNFLRHTKLNKQITEMANKAIINEGNDTRSASDRTKRIVFEKDNDTKASTINNNNNNRKYKSKNNNSIYTTTNNFEYNNNNNKWEGRNNQKFTKFDKNPKTSIFSTGRFRADSTSSSNSNSDDDDNDDVEWEDAEHDNDDNNNKDKNLISASIVRKDTIHIGSDTDDDDDDDDDTGGGFLKADTNSALSNNNNSTNNNSKLPPHRRVIHIDDSDDDDDNNNTKDDCVGGFIPSGSNNIDKDAQLAQELQDESLARAIHIAQQFDNNDDNETDSNDGGGGGFFTSSIHDDRNQEQQDNDVGIEGAGFFPSHAIHHAQQHDDDDDGGGGGAGFFPSSTQDEDEQKEQQDNDTGKGEEDGGGGFFPSSTNEDIQKEQQDNDTTGTDNGNDDVAGAGFFPSTHKTNEKQKEDNDDNDDDDDVIVMTSQNCSTTTFATVTTKNNQQKNDELLARVLQNNENMNSEVGDSVLARALQDSYYEEDNKSSSNNIDSSLERQNKDTTTTIVAVSKQQQQQRQKHNNNNNRPTNLYNEKERLSEAIITKTNQKNQFKTTHNDTTSFKDQQTLTNESSLTKSSKGQDGNSNRQDGTNDNQDLDDEGDDEDDDDDVDWEDGDIDDEEQKDNDDIVVTDNGIDRRNEQLKLDEEPKKTTSKKFVDSTADESVRQQQKVQEERTLEVLDEIQPKEDTQGTNFGFVGEESDPWSDNFKPNASSGDMAAALEQAQATAANLTNWAGRAFRRAMATHAEATGVTPVTNVTPTKPTKESVAEPNVFSIDDDDYDEAMSHERTNRDDTTKDKLEHSTTISESRQGFDSPPQKTTNDPTNHSVGSQVTSSWPELINGEEALESIEQYKKKWEEARKRKERDMETLTDEMKTEALELLQLFGVPYVESPSEAEAQCVMLEQLGLVDGIVTEDSDVFVFGGKNIYKNMFDDQKYVEVYHAKDAEKEMNISHDGMVALAMLLGGDYTEGVKGVGIVNGMEILEAFEVSKDLESGLKAFRKWLDGFDPTDALEITKGKKEYTSEQRFHKNHHTARTRWIAPKNFPDEKVMSAYLNPVVDKSDDRFSWGVPDLERLMVFCNRHAGWTPEETKRLLEPVIQKVESRSRQTRIDSFMRYEDGIKFANVRSKRLQDVLHGVKKKNGKRKKS